MLDHAPPLLEEDSLASVYFCVVCIDSPERGGPYWIMPRPAGGGLAAFSVFLSCMY